MRLRFSFAFVLSLLLGAFAFAQSNPTGTLSGVVTDPSGAAIPAAAITVTQESTHRVMNLQSDATGRFVVANLSPDKYDVAVNHVGFQASVYKAVTILVGQTYTLNAKLKVGQATQTVEVQAGQQVLQTESTAISHQVTGSQITSIPISSRNSQDLAIIMPSLQTTTSPRNSTFEGLPSGSINLTFDGINSQDNVLKSSGGSAFFSTEQPRLDDVQEMSVTTAANDASSSGEGAVQVAFVSQKGTNQWHGGGWEYLRNNWLNANYYFNNLNGLPRQVLRLNEFGYKIGGPILKNKLFFFTDFDFWENPQGQARSRNILTDDAAQGLFTYAVKSIPTIDPNKTPWVTCSAAASTCTADLMQMAGDAARNGTGQAFTSSVDTLEAQIIAETNKVVGAPGVTLGAAPSFNQRQVNFNANAASQRKYPDLRLDYNINSANSLEFDYHYAHYFDGPDVLNNADASFPVAPFNTNQGAQISNRNLFALAWRSQITPNINNELRVGGQSAPLWFDQGQVEGLYPTIKTDVGDLRMRPGVPSLMSQPFNRFGPGGRNAPLKQVNETVSWLHGNHAMTLGGTFTSVTWKNDDSGQQVSSVGVGLGSNANVDPAAALFNSGNLPGASSTDRGTARGLYGALAGRITSFSDTINANPVNRTYQPNYNAFEQVSQKEFSTFFSDSWHVKPNLTFNYGLRWEYEGTPTDDLNIYSVAAGGADGVFGVSGYNGLFKPGVINGNPTSFLNDRGQGFYPAYKKSFAPSIGLAWTPSASGGLLGTLFGSGGQSVLRAGYSIAYDRQGLSDFEGFVGANPGLTNDVFMNASTSNGGGAFQGGSLQLQNQNIANGLSARARGNIQFGQPFDINPLAGDQVNAYAPGLAQPMVQSWSAGFQRQLNSNTALEVRYVGNHATRQWTSGGVNYNEVNIFENGFLKEFNNALNNLNLCNCSSFANQGIPGQVDLPIFQAAFTGAKTGAETNAEFTDAGGDFVSDLQTGQAGAAASELADYNGGLLANMVAAGYPVNFFQANPQATGGAWLLTDLNQSTYNGLQVELRRRMASGVQFDANYTWSHSIGTGDVDTLRNYGSFKAPSSSDLRHVFKFEQLFELPFGPGHRWKSSNGLVNTLIGGWEWDGITRIQSGSRFEVTGGSSETFNDRNDGIQVLGTSVDAIQSKLGVSKQTTSKGAGIVYYAPNSLLGVGQKQSNNAVLAPCATAGAMCFNPYLYGPAFLKADWSLVKNTKLSERVTMTLRANVLDAFNNVNFQLPASGSITSNSFMQITRGYQDFTSTQDPGGRVIELQARINF